MGQFGSKVDRAEGDDLWSAFNACAEREPNAADAAKLRINAIRSRLLAAASLRDDGLWEPAIALARSARAAALKVAATSHVDGGTVGMARRLTVVADETISNAKAHHRFADDTPATPLP
jgi:hypothetical protein